MDKDKIISDLKSKVRSFEDEEIRLRERLQEASKKISHYQNKYLELLGEHVRPKTLVVSFRNE